MKHVNSFFSLTLRTVDLLLTEFVMLPWGLLPAGFLGTGKGEARKPGQAPIDEVAAAAVVVTLDLSDASGFLDTVP